jgi:hypothetical protein
LREVGAERHPPELKGLILPRAGRQDRDTQVYGRRPLEQHLLHIRLDAHSVQAHLILDLRDGELGSRLTRTTARQARASDCGPNHSNR